MSWYTAGEILLWLLAAAVLGFLLGYFIRGWLAARRTRERELALEREVQDARDAKLSLERDLELCRDARAGLDRDLQKCREARAALEAELTECKDARIALENKALSTPLAASVGASIGTPVAATAAASLTGPGLTLAKPSASVAVEDTDATVDSPAKLAASAWAREKVAEIAVRTAGDGANPRDDLREIHGIGEVISKMLYSMNITSFRQIARFTPSDIATVSHALEVFPDRIERDNWMSSARQLHKDKYGYDPCE